MRFSVVFAAIVLVATPVFAAPSSLLTVEKYEGETSGRYIVKYKDGVTASSRIAADASDTVELPIINGFSAKLNNDALNALRASPDVEYITEDGFAHILETQTNAPWGLQRISQRSKLSSTDPTALTYTYTYNSNPGAGVDVYVVDTGINTAHSEFGGRASWGATFGRSNADADGNGHGTHCAGTITGSRYGVSKAANVIAVKVLSDAGSGPFSDIVAGLNWVLTQAQASGRPSIVSMSLSGFANTAADNAVAVLASNGVHVVVAAGNNNSDAGEYSPSRAPSAITVGASTISDARASFSNYGSVVDVFAPGQNITSAWIDSTTATNSISGTSMATPHVAGLAAYLISRDGNVSPAELEAKIKMAAVSGLLTDLPEGTANLIVQNF